MNNQQNSTNQINQNRKTKIIKKSCLGYRNCKSANLQALKFYTWSKEDVLKYLVFISFKKMRQYLQIRLIKWRQKAIKQMSAYIQTKTFQQCLQYHNFMSSKYRSISNIINQLSKRNEISFPTQQTAKLHKQLKQKYKDRFILKSYYQLAKQQKEKQFQVKVHETDIYRFIDDQNSHCMLQTREIDDQKMIQSLKEIFEKISFSRQVQNQGFKQQDELKNENKQQKDKISDKCAYQHTVPTIQLNLGKRKNAQGGLQLVYEKLESQGQQHQKSQIIQTKIQKQQYKPQPDIADYSKYTPDNSKWSNYQLLRLLTFFIYNKDKFGINKQKKSYYIFKQMSMYIGTDKIPSQCTDKVWYLMHQNKNLQQDKLIQKLKIHFNISDQELDEQRLVLEQFYRQFHYSHIKKFSVKKDEKNFWFVDSFTPRFYANPQNIEIIQVNSDQAHIKITEKMKIYLAFSEKKKKQQ